MERWTELLDRVGLAIGACARHVQIRAVAAPVFPIVDFFFTLATHI